MSIYLPFEIFQHIFININEDDIETLHSALLVNRTWCQNVIQYLWKKPFNIYPLLKNIQKIIPILLSSLDVERKDYLKIKDPRLEIPINTLFDYSCFIKQIHFGHIHASILKWIIETRNFRPSLETDYFINHESKYNYNFNYYNDGQMKIEDQEIFSFLEAIFDVITSKCGNIQILYLGYDVNSICTQQHIYTSFYQILLSTPNARNCLINLENFNCIDNWFREEFFIILTKVSHNIKSIYIDLYGYSHTEKDGEAFKNLIKSQNNLEEFIINYHDFGNLSEILIPLKYQTHSLRSIKICFGVINTLQFLTKCIQLEELIFNQVEFVGALNVLTNVVFPNLKIFHFNNIYYSYLDSIGNQLLYFIQNNKNLQELSMLVNLPLYPNTLLKVISENCKNLLSFTVRIRNDNEITLLFPLLKNCQQLKSLFISLDECEYIATPVIQNVKEFAQIIPLNLVTLDLTRWIFDISVLNNLLENLHHPVKYFKFICNENIEEIEIIINNYSKENNLEIFSFNIQKNAWRKFSKINIEWKYL